LIKQKTAYELLRRLVGSEMRRRDRDCGANDDIGRIETPAQADLENQIIGWHPCESEKGGGGRDLEKLND